MLCEICKQREATVYYTTPELAAKERMRHICESCLQEISPKSSAEIEKIKVGEKHSSGWTSYSPNLENKETPAPAPSDFIRDIVAKHVAEKKYPKITTRFPPEPNGY